MASKIQVRRDTLSNWNANNPVLSSGEIAFVSDENKFKVGNGSSAFSSLPYLQADAYIDSVILGTDTTGNYVETMVSGNGISLSGQGSESASVTVTNTGVLSLAGTANEVEVSASTGSVTISLPSTINANTTGSAATLTNARIIALSGDVSGSANFDGSASISINAEIQPNSVALGTDTTGNYVATATAGSGIGISGSGSENAAITISNTGVRSLTGTANQISVSASNGDPTISLPSAVTFPGTVTLNADPTQALQAATKQYVDAVAEGLHIHASVSAATTTNINLSSPPAAIDNVTLTNNMRVLVKDQSTLSQNGIYRFNGSALVRASDFNSSSEIQGGDFLFVTGGNTYADTGWVQTENVTTLGTDPIMFTQFSGAGTYSAGTGLQLDGTVFSNTGVLSLQGTANEVEVSASSGAVTISLPETINANTTGSAATLTTSRTIELTGDVTGSASFNGGANATISATIAPNSVELGTDTAGNYIATISGTTDQISVSGSGSENAAVTLSLPSTINVNTSGNSATSTKLATAREIALSGDVTGSANFDGSASVSISSTLANSGVSANSYGSASATGTFTVDAKGRLTAASNTPIAIAQSAVTNLTTDLSAKAPLASPTFTGTVTIPTLFLTTADTTTAASHYIVETGSDGILRPKTLANVQSEIVTNAAVNSASATILGTVTAGTWNASTISATYIDNAIARLASPALTGTPTAPTAALGTNTTQVATTEFVQSRFSGSTIDTKTASHSLVLADAGKTIEMNVGSANNLTVPLNSSQAFPIGTTIDVIQYGAGQTTIVATGGVTLRSKDGNLKLSGQYSGATLYKRGTDEWLIVGDLTT